MTINQSPLATHLEDENALYVLDIIKDVPVGMNDSCPNTFRKKIALHLKPSFNFQ